MHPANYLTAGAKEASDIFAEFESRYSNVLSKKNKRNAKFARKYLEAIATDIEAKRESGKLKTKMEGVNVVAYLAGK